MKLMPSIGLFTFCALPLTLASASGEVVQTTNLPEKLEQHSSSSEPADQQVESLESTKGEPTESQLELKELFNDAEDLEKDKSGFASAVLVRKTTDTDDWVIKGVSVATPELLARFERETDSRLRACIEEINPLLKTGSYGQYGASCIVPEEKVFVGEDSLSLAELGLSAKALQLESKPGGISIDDDSILAYSIQTFGGESVMQMIENSIILDMPIPRRTIAKLVLGAVSVYKCLGERNFVHRDGSILNFLRGPNDTFVLVDFGFQQELSHYNTFEFKGRPETYLPHFRHKYGQYRGNLRELRDVSRNTMRAQDLWSCVLMLYTLITKVPLISNTINDKPGWHKKWFRSLDHVFHAYKDPDENKQRTEVLYNVVGPLINLLGRKTVDDVVDVSVVFDHILNDDFGKPLRDWLNEKDPCLVNESKSFDTAYKSKFGTPGQSRTKRVRFKAQLLKTIGTSETIAHHHDPRFGYYNESDKTDE